MKQFEFFKFSPSGNMTVFLLGNMKDSRKRAHYCREAIGQGGVGGEQAAFAQPALGTFMMGGGEFCVNAARAFGALLDIYAGKGGRIRSYSASVQGLGGTIGLEVCGKAPEWIVTAEFDQAVPELRSLSDGKILAILPGITHLLIEASTLPDQEQALSKGGQLVKFHSLTGYDAIGVIWWRENAGSIEILPYVSVPASDTEMVESACGSASLALASHLAPGGSLRIRQPSGAVLEVCAGRGRTVVTGAVALAAKGAVWLPEPGLAGPDAGGFTLAAGVNLPLDMNI